MRICKECRKEYFRSEYFQHIHGKNHPRYGVYFNTSEETKRKMSIVHKGKVYTKDHRKKISEGLKGHFVSEKTRRKISEANAGKTFSIIMKKRWKDGVYNGVRFNSFGNQGFRKDIGHFVRSTWEANFARILIYEGIDYEYEPIHYDLGYTTYTPDFYLPEKDIYIEIKGQDTKEARGKRIMTRKMHGIKIKVIEKIKYLRLQNHYKELILVWE